jgi:hypothetical protein
VAPAAGDDGKDDAAKKAAELDDEEAEARAELDVEAVGLWRRQRDKNWFKRWLDSKVQQVKDSVLGE